MFQTISVSQLGNIFSLPLTPRQYTHIQHIISVKFQVGQSYTHYITSTQHCALLKVLS